MTIKLICSIFFLNKSFYSIVNFISIDGLNSNPKLLADDTALLPVVLNINSTANDLNSDLIKISDCAF